MDFQYSVDTYGENSLSSLETIENIIVTIHKEDSILYKTLLIENSKDFDTFQSEMSFENKTTLSNSITNLFNSLNENRFKTSVLVDFDTIFTIEKLRTQIIETHKLQLISSQDNYEVEINQLLMEYEELIKRTISTLNKNIEDIKEENEAFSKNLKEDLKIKFLIILLFYIISIPILYYINEFDVTFSKNTTQEKVVENHNVKPKHYGLLDSDLKNIISYVEKQIRNGYFPTIKEIKSEFNLTHPTVNSKLKILEDKKIILIKKQGRNKHIVLNK